MDAGAPLHSGTCVIEYAMLGCCPLLMDAPMLPSHCWCNAAAATLPHCRCHMTPLLVHCRAVARFLFISVTFETRLHVWEDDIHRKIRFCNAQEG